MTKSNDPSIPPVLSLTRWCYATSKEQRSAYSPRINPSEPSLMIVYLLISESRRSDLVHDKTSEVVTSISVRTSALTTLETRSIVCLQVNYPFPVCRLPFSFLSILYHGWRSNYSPRGWQNLLSHFAEQTWCTWRPPAARGTVKTITNSQLRNAHQIKILKRQFRLS